MTERRTEGRRLSIRARAMLAFGLVSFVLSGTLALVAYSLVRSALIDDRENAAVRQAFTNARAVRTRITADDRAVTGLLAGLQLASTGDVLLQRDGLWYTSTVEADRSVIPVSLRQGVDQGHAGSQGAATAGSPVLVVGIPITALNASYYEVNSLDDLNRTLRVLGSSLLLAAVVAAGFGALTGAVVSRSVVRPLRTIAAVATDIAAGESDARLRAAGDPDLEPLALSFNGMVDDLEERIRREARFASDVSHDLRGPLTALSAAVSVVNRRRAQLPPEASLAIDLLDEQVVAFNRLVVDLLEISRFEAGTATLQTREVGALDFVRAVLAERGDTIPVNLTANRDIRVSIDPRRMQQVLANLLDNAHHYGGGATAIEIDTAAGSARVRICVDDDGPGVDPQERQVIFDRFHRGHRGTAPGAPRGTGLGLALAFDHVALHQGELWVEDGPSGGARFVIELPAVDAADHQDTGR
jgi:two-component system sensor histidine kinase MtrB